MYEETKSSFDWKGLILKVIIAFLVVLIVVKGYSLLKPKTNNTNNATLNQNNTQEVADSKNNSTFASNMERLRTAGKSYFEKNKEQIPAKEGISSLITLGELVEKGYITELKDEDGNKCDLNSSYIAATIEGKDTKIKTNLVCGKSAQPSVVYLNNNVSTETETKKEETKKETSTKKEETSNKKQQSTSNKEQTTINKTQNSSTCTTTGCGVNVEVDVNVENKVTVNDNANTSVPEKKYYIVKFDSNGGYTYYNDQRVEENKTAYNPGGNTKIGCDFKGWRYEGIQYDFNTPVTKDMTLEAFYACDEENEEESKFITTYVYSMAWDTKGIDGLTVKHTLRLPQEIEDLNPTKVRIDNIEFYEPINTQELADEYNEKHYDTFFYDETGWEANEKTRDVYLSTIKGSAVKFSYSDDFKKFKSALNNGFDVKWKANSIKNDCIRTFTVNNVTGLCNYGIVYEVTWELKF